MIKIPNEYIFDSGCRNLLVEHLKDYIIYHGKEYAKQGFNIFMHDKYLRTIYNHHVYKITIVSDNNFFYYYLQPYNKSYFITLANNPKSFEMVLYAIKEHENLLKRKGN